MTEWIDVDVTKINQNVSKNIHGVDVKVAFSPYDVPRRYRGYREPNGNFFVVEFQYLLDEATIVKKPSADAPVELEIGQNSKRIYKIKLDATKFGCDCVRVEFDLLARKEAVKAIEWYKKTVPSKLQERYKLPENVVFNDRGRVFSDFVAA